MAKATREEIVAHALRLLAGDFSIENTREMIAHDYGYQPGDPEFEAIIAAALKARDAVS